MTTQRELTVILVNGDFCSGSKQWWRERFRSCMFPVTNSSLNVFKDFKHINSLLLSLTDNLFCSLCMYVVTLQHQLSTSGKRKFFANTLKALLIIWINHLNIRMIDILLCKVDILIIVICRLFATERASFLLNTGKQGRRKIWWTSCWCKFVNHHLLYRRLKRWFVYQS